MPEPRPTDKEKGFVNVIQTTTTSAFLVVELTEETPRNEHANITRSRLQSRTEDDNETADQDTPLPARPIRQVGSNGQSADRTDRLDGIQKTLFGALRVVEICKASASASVHTPTNRPISFRLWI